MRYELNYKQILKMSRWNSHTHEEEEVDFEQILTQKPSGVQLLTHPNLLEEVKSRSSKFTQKIIEQKHRAVLNDLIDIALTPRAFNLSREVSLTRADTHTAIEILSNLSEQFMEQIFDKQGEEEDSVVQSEREYPILNQLFRVLASPDAEETALAYFNKLVTPFIYQRSEEMMRLANSHLLPQLLNYFWNQSVSEVINKLLEGENQKDFFEKQKVQLINNLCRKLSSQKDQNKVELNMESFAAFIESLVEKHQDKYEKTKYAKLIKNILEHSHAFLFLFQLFEQHQQNRTIKVHILHCIEAFLRLHLPTKQQSKISEESDSPPDSFTLKQDFAEHLRKWLNNHMIHQFVSDSRLELLAYYKLIKTAIAAEPTLISSVLNQQFLSETLRFMRNDPNNNILHNYQREVLVSGIRESEKVFQIMQDQMGLEEELRSKIKPSANSDTSMENQLFLIGEVIKEKSQKSQLQSEGWSSLNQLFDVKRQFYSAVIGGNPRGNDDKWDSMQNENEMILRSLNQKDDYGAEKQTIEEKLDVDVDLPQKKIMIHIASGLDDLGGTEVLSEEEDDPFTTPQTDDPKINKHFFDFELPLDSDKDEQSNSLDDVPLVIKIESNYQSLRASSNVLSNSNSSNTAEQLKTSKESERINLEVVIQDPLIEQTVQIVIEQSFKEQPTPEENIQQQQQPQPQPLSIQPVYYRREEIETALACKYGITLKEKIIIPQKEEIERSLLAKYGLTLKPSSTAIVPVRQQVSTSLFCKYGLTLE